LDLVSLLGRIDRRILYLGLAIFTLVPMVLQWDLPAPVSQPVQSLYDTVAQVPADGVVVLGTDWDAGTQAENRPQMVALVRHLLRRRLKFAMISVGYPQSPQLSQDVVDEAIREETRLDPGLDFRYGRDYVNLGYKELTRPWLLAFIQDTPAQVRADWKNRPLSETFMTGVRQWGTGGQVQMFVDITGSSTLEEWRPLLYPKGVRVAGAVTAVMAPEQYPFLANRQMVGMLTGLKGAAEYEKLLNYKGTAYKNMRGQSFAHVYILLLLVLGNIATVSGLRRGRARRGRTA
jgi:hypothetical protein